MTSGPKGRVRLSREARRDQLLDTAASIIVEDGIRGLTMMGLAERAGVATSLGWAYFDNIEQVAEELYDREVRALHGAVVSAIADAPSFEAKLRAALNAYRITTGERAGLLTALGPELTARATAPVPRGIRFAAVWVELIEQHFSITSPRSWMIATMTLAAADAIVRFPYDEQSWPLVEQQLVDFVIGGIEGSIV